MQTLTSPGSPECIRVPPPKNQKNNNTGTSHRASAFAPKIVARARRGVGAATGETPPTAETAPTDETPRTDVTAPKELPAGEAPAAAARRAPNLTSRRLDDAPSTAPRPAAARAVPPAVPSTQLRAPAATDPHANPNLPRTLEHEARLRAAMPPPPSVPPSAPSAAAPGATPPAHRWVRGAATTRGNRVHLGSPRANAAAMAAGTPVDEALARSIRDIIRQRSREERASEARVRGAKRRDGGGSLGDQSGSGAARGRAPNTALALVDTASRVAVGVGGADASAAPQLASALALPPAGARVGQGGFGAGPHVMTPQVLVVDGQIVINEKSLTVNAAVERATALSDFTRVEESGTKLNSATYANYTKAEKWTAEDTEFFFQALAQFGTDFSLIQRLFPGRTRRQIKKKYLVEDKTNARRVEAAVRNKNPDVTLYKNLISVLTTTPAGADRVGGAAQGNVARTVLTGVGTAGRDVLALPAPGPAVPVAEKTAPATATPAKPKGGVPKGIHAERTQHEPPPSPVKSKQNETAVMTGSFTTSTRRSTRR